MYYVSTGENMSIQNETSAKSSRLNLRVSAEQEELIRSAAASVHKTLTDFVLESAVEQAAQVLLDRQLFVVDTNEWADWQELLDRPAKFNQSFADLLALADDK